MASRNDILNKFVYGETRGKASSLSISKEGKGTALYSHATPIAYRDSKGNIFATDKKFSQSTTIQQNTLKRTTNVKVLDNDTYKEKLRKEDVYSSGRL